MQKYTIKIKQSATDGRTLSQPSSSRKGFGFLICSKTRFKENGEEENSKDDLNLTSY